MYCISCNRNNVLPMSIHSNKSEEDELWRNDKHKHPDGNETTRSINNAMVDNGIIHIIDAGYGSIHDTSRLIIAICDECVSRKLEDATLLYYGNYMHYDFEEDINLSKKRYRRRKNLDNLEEK